MSHHKSSILTFNLCFQEFGINSKCFVSSPFFFFFFFFFFVSELQAEKKNIVGGISADSTQQVEFKVFLHPN